MKYVIGIGLAAVFLASVYLNSADELPIESGIIEGASDTELTVLAPSINDNSAPARLDIVNESVVGKSVPAAKEPISHVLSIESVAVLLDAEPYGAIPHLVALSRMELDRVLDWLESSSHELTWVYYNAVVQDVLRRNDIGAFYLLFERLTELPDDLVNRSKIIADVAQELVEREGPELILERSDLEESVSLAVLVKWARQNPTEVWEFIELNPELSTRLTTDMLVTAAFSSSIDGVKEQLVRLYELPDAIQSQLGPVLIERLHEWNIDEAQEWISAQPPSRLKDRIIESVIRQHGNSFSPYELLALSGQMTEAYSL